MVTTVGVCYPGRCAQVDQPASVTADENGMFSLTANLPESWREVLLGVAAAGYEPARKYVVPSSSTTAVLEVYCTLTIRPGESIEMRVFLGHYVCGDESVRCRRIVVESAGELVDLEVTPIDGQGDAGLMPSAVFFDTVFQRRLTVAGGEAWIIGALPNGVTLTARRH